MKSIKRHKILAIIVGLILAGVVVTAMLLRPSDQFGSSADVLVYVIVAIYGFFIPSAVAFFFYTFEPSIGNGFRLGVHIAFGIFEILIAPFFGMRFLLMKEDEVR